MSWSCQSSWKNEHNTFNEDVVDKETKKSEMWNTAAHYLLKNGFSVSKFDCKTILPWEKKTDKNLVLEHKHWSNKYQQLVYRSSEIEQLFSK